MHQRHGEPGGHGSLYGCLGELIAAEQQMALYSFSESGAEIKQMLNRFEHRLQRQT